MDLSRYTKDPAAADVLANLEKRFWRKARDAAKDLCKRDRNAYLDLLIAANAGLAREMLQKGLKKEAATVIDYLASFAPGELVSQLKLELATQTAPRPLAPGGGSSAGSHYWETALQVDQAIETSGGSELQDAEMAVIDLLVSDAFVPTFAADNSRASRLAAELATVRRACDATGDGRWDEAREALRQLPSRSIFRHWRMFLRGARCVFEDDFQTARQCFGELPRGGALSMAARAMAPDFVCPGPAPPMSGKVAFLLSVTGQPSAWTTPLLDAITAWRQGHRRKALVALASGMKGRFPSIGTDFPAVLTEVISPYRTRMTADDERRANVLMRTLVDSPGLTATQRTLFHLAAMRAMCVAEAATMYCADLHTYWKETNTLLHQFSGPDPLRDSLAWQWLGEVILETLDPDRSLDLYDENPAKAFRIARTSLEQSVKCDPDNQAAWLSLVRLHDTEGDTKARNRLLDELWKRFPENKEILVQAGRLALERKSYEKGISALRQALALDPLDKLLKTYIATALVLVIRQRISKKRPAHALWDDLEALAEDRPDPAYQQLTRWMIRLRRSLLDPDPGLSASAREDAFRMAPSSLEFSFFEHALALVYQNPLRIQTRANWDRALAAGPVSWDSLFKLFDLVCFFTQIAEWSWQMNHSIQARIIQMLKMLLRDSLDDEPEGPLILLDIGDPDRKIPATQFTKMMLIECEREAAAALTRLTPPGTSNPDPSLRLAQLFLDRSPLAGDISSKISELEKIATEAASLGRALTLTRARTLAATLSKMAARRQIIEEMPPDFYDDDEDEEDNWEEWEEEDEWDEEDDIPPRGGVNPQNAIAELNKIVDAALESGDPAVIGNLKDLLTNHGVPKQEIDKLFSRAEAIRPPPRISSSGKSGKSGKKGKNKKSTRRK